MRAIGLARLLAVSLILTGCAGQTIRQTEQLSWSDHRRQLINLTNWKVTGKLALRTAEQSESGSMIWRQQEDDTQLNLSGPLGVGATTIAATSSDLEIRRNGQIHIYDISTPETIIRDTGWDLPVHALPHWLKGMATPRLEVGDQVVEQGLLRRLEQQGWIVTYQAYRQFEHYMLPTQLRIERDQTRARVIIRQWKIFTS
ncbi:MAG: outer membrane lipoprotein LolB [Halieaceae bacterium]|nr:outer membrane lipoprotein LolB [Halieaceae bacterium]